MPSMSRIIERAFKSNKRKAIIPPENYELCPKCEGFPNGKTFDTTSYICCEHCNGKGYVDWIEFILGKKKENAPMAGAHNHHQHLHIQGGGAGVGVSMVGAGGGGCRSAGMTSHSMGGIVGGPGVTVKNTHSNINSSQSGMCTISVADPTIEIDIKYIKEELKDWIEEHIKNEVSRRVGDELMRRGVK